MAVPSESKATTVVVPNAAATTDGDSNLTTPGTNAPRTYQAQIAASQLSSIPVGDIITGMTFRIAAGGPASSAASFTNWDLTLAQAANTVSTMSTNFASNMSNPVTVRSGALSFNAGDFPTGATAPAVNPFGVVISFTSPYTYQGGDLVFEFSHTAGSASVGFFDAAAGAGQGYGTLFQAQDALSYNATVASSTVALTIPQFTFSAPAPEPASAGLCGLGAMLLASRRTRAREGRAGKAGL